jgi:hypothetical protein
MTRAWPDSWPHRGPVSNGSGPRGRDLERVPVKKFNFLVDNAEALD